MSEWEIKTNNYYDVEFYQDGEFFLGSSVKNKLNPFVLEYKFYDRTDENFITIKETQRFLFWYRYKIIHHDFTMEKFDISHLHANEFLIDNVKFNCKLPLLPERRIVTFYKNNSELGCVKLKGIFKNGFEITLNEESDNNLYFCVVASIFIEGALRAS